MECSKGHTLEEIKTPHKDPEATFKCKLCEKKNETYKDV